MLSVTVMMLRDMVESVMLLKEEACRGRQVRGCEWDPSARPSLHLSSPHLTGPHLPAHTCKIHTCRAHTCQSAPTRSVCRRRCFRRRRLCFRMSLEEVLCSVELLSLGGPRVRVWPPPT